ncbi:Decaprenyl diphosphate synthase-like protein [Gamsiella multidivaricata]|uniref:Decaprenyl diphosphate synthase-like protein n=1 Tax=Gamsiella multidivaricata TaxID=101098 RepID=UPI00222021DE|nr:Decaprenyl diphosphate synthase-like protein [Gamsiella multidivaricata]KAI7817083.1 Decaprenyl diphosphate synthase-like protein [Gamsiella multidivaricata]
MPSPATTLRRRGISPPRDISDNNSSSGTERTTTLTKEDEQSPLKSLRTPSDLIAAHPAIKPLSRPATSPFEVEDDASTTTTTPTSAAAVFTPSIALRILHVLLKPFYFLLFALLHLGHELLISARTMKTLVQVFFLPHKFPTAPEIVRVLRQDLGEGLEKQPKHLAVILPADASSSEQEEEEWHAKVAQLVQWSVASGVKCLSIMRTDPLHPQVVDALQERIDDSLVEFYREEGAVPVARVRTLRPVENSLQAITVHQSETQRQQRLHGGRAFDLDVVILAERDGHDRLAANVRALGEAALQKEIQSQDVTMKSLDQQLSAELSEPELLIVFKDDLDLSSYPPWHIRLTEIYHHSDQAIIPQYTMFLQALHRYAKCEQRFGK